MSNTAGRHTNPNSTATATASNCCLRNINYIQSIKSKFNIKLKLFGSKIGFTKRSCTFQVCFLFAFFVILLTIMHVTFIHCLYGIFLKFGFWFHFRKPAVPPQSPNTPLSTPNAGQVRWWVFFCYIFELCHWMVNSWNQKTFQWHKIPPQMSS